MTEKEPGAAVMDGVLKYLAAVKANVGVTENNPKVAWLLQEISVRLRSWI
jgi:hypothetical protein